MSEFKPTASQSAAITARGGTVLVSAGAGSGKTKVLTERLMGYIAEGESPADLDSFLIITFTRAAAGELRGRITEELAARIARDPANRRLRRQSALCRRAQIGTIHSFCASLLRENSHLAGISPDFKIVDEERARVMRSAALERVLEERYENSDAYPGFIALADTVGIGRDDRRLAELVETLHDKMQCHARPDAWARKQVELFRADVSDIAETPWGHEILTRAKESACYWSGELDKLMLAMGENEKISNAYMPSVSETASQIRELVRCLDIGWEKARACLPIEFPRLGTLRNSPDPALSDSVRLSRDACKKAMGAIEKTLSDTSDKLLDEIRLSADAMGALLSLTLDFDAQYSAAKRRAGLMDYSDLEHTAARILTNEDGEPTELAVRLSARYTEVMVDEYQDVSRVQDEIFKAVSDGGRKLFLVGDVKQSIYRFRLADPGIFTEKYLSYPDADKATPGEPSRILLQENFRSRREILDCANAVFRCCMSEGLGDIDYDDDAALRCGASYPPGGAVPELLLCDMVQSYDEDDERPDAKAMEARMVGEEILKLMSSGMTVNGRPLQYGDITILMRSANSVGGIYRRELAALGIPVTAGQGGGLFASTEVSDVMSLLAVIDNPHQDIPLIAALRSPAFGFTPEKLADVRACNGTGDFYAALCAAAENDADCAAFTAWLGRMRSLAPDLAAGELLWQVIDELDLLALYSAMSDGAQRRANLLALLELSERFDATLYRGVHRFVLWLRQLAEKGKEPSGGAAYSSAVQIMTVHKSKGLEFPVVFLCNTATRFNRKDNQSPVLVHPELGLGPKVTDTVRRVEYPGLARNAIRLRLEREMLSEEMRLLYVALTRPRERLYITAAVKDSCKLIETSRTMVTNPMAVEVLAGVSAPVNWLVYAALADGEEHLKLRVCKVNGEAGNTPKTPDAPPADAAAIETLRQNLAFVYPHRASETLPSKITATELKGRAEEEEESDGAPLLPKVRRAFAMPDFARTTKPVAGKERGVATHLALQCMRLDACSSLAAVEGEIVRLEREKYLSAREAAAVDAGAIYRLFESPLGQRILHADKLHREFKFSLLCDAGELYPDAAGEELLLQGVVDCCIEENGRLTVIDYKTDHVSSDAEVTARAEFYKGQVSAYAAALRRIFGMEVVSCVLYFLHSGKIAEIAQKDLQ